MKKIIIATRNSELALYQANLVGQQLSRKHKGLRYELLPVENELSNDINMLKDVFVKKCEEALLDRRADLAVHSAKDIPIKTNESLKLSAFCRRANPLDALILSSDYRQMHSIENIPDGITIGTSSPRRSLQMLKYKADIKVLELRGNLSNRIDALDSNYDGIILAAAGLKRLKKVKLISGYFNPCHIVPAPGQGILAIQNIRLKDELTQLASSLNHKETSLCITAERHCCYCLGADCDSPVGVYAFFEYHTMRIYTMVGDITTGKVVRAKISMEPPSKIWDEHYAKVCGEKAANELISLGADKMLSNSINR